LVVAICSDELVAITMEQSKGEQFTSDKAILKAPLVKRRKEATITIREV
jgi:hypothetical protein